ncbi:MULTISPECIES: cupin domain-containing protein [unclassified Streptomyces]|uniref:cupin domain-containing protein n=1 Tax=unclassified Streptomyces TaxID=2593676 RepID=UPI0028C3DFA9|nr:MULTISPECIES: hypothetical protein [unclassified Streptomyces]WNO71714.1 hypothetical protein RPQ07_08735 [Streptomyces sp. AM8-1-1]
MTVSPRAGVLAGLADVRAVPVDRGGALWRLSEAGRQLDANIIRVPPGDRVARHAEADLDVLLCVLDGSGELETDAGRQRLEAGSVAWLPRGSHRALSAGADGLAYVTAHTRRPGLAIRNASASAVAAVSAEPEGGEAACLLNRICPACDRPAEAIDARYCTRCGSSLAP